LNSQLWAHYCHTDPFHCGKNIDPLTEKLINQPNPFQLGSIETLLLSRRFLSLNFPTQKMSTGSSVLDAQLAQRRFTEVLADPSWKEK